MQIVRIKIVIEYTLRFVYIKDSYISLIIMQDQFIQPATSMAMRIDGPFSIFIGKFSHIIIPQKK